MEWNAVIPLGQGKVNVPFRNGSYDGRGVSAATYRTEDAFFQAVIEQSDFFAQGKIFIVADERVEIPEEDEENQTQEEETDDSGDDSGDDSDGLQEVEVASREDAKQYLMETYGLAPSGLSSKAKIQASAKAHGIRFIGADDLE